MPLSRLDALSYLGFHADPLEPRTHALFLMAPQCARRL